MGRAARWLRSLLGGKKKNKEKRDESNDGGGGGGGGGGLCARKEKKRWSFAKSVPDSKEVVLGKDASTATAAAVEVTWFQSLYEENAKEQRKHAIVVPEAIKAAANAAVAAAKASAAHAARLANNGRGADVFCGVHEREAAVRIQTAFRRYLAKRALRALKGLVKLQALARGYLVRKQAAATLHIMQALVRAQATVRAQRAPNLLSSDRSLHAESRPRMSMERFDEAQREHLSPFHSRGLSASLDSSSNGFDRSPQMIDMDTCRPKSRSSRRTSPSFFEPSENSNSNWMPSPLPPCRIPVQITIPNCRNFQDHDWCLAGNKRRASATAHSTPRYVSASCNAPVTPAKRSASGATVLRRLSNGPNCPNYMSSTQSFVAKVRSQSAPRQRPEPNGLTKKRVPLSEIMLDARASLSGAGMQRSCNRAQQEAFSFKSAVVGKLERSSEFGRNTQSDQSYFHTHW